METGRNAPTGMKRQAQVLAALAAGCETSAEVAIRLGLPPMQASDLLHVLYELGALEREPRQPRQRGRPGFRYRIRRAS